MKKPQETVTIVRRGRGPARLALSFMLLIVSHCLVQAASQTDVPMNLPETVGTWKRTEPPRRIKPAEIFDYMDGAGELYIGYRFRHLDVYDYSGSDDTQILVEIYQMETSSDAFGLLSLDWGGEPVNFKAEASRGASGQDSSTTPGALYGAGLLRLWSGQIFARILAERETPESRKAVMELGKSIAGNRDNPSPPRLLGALPKTVVSYDLAAGRAAFLRSYLVLNSIYYLGAQNILNLGLDCEAVTGAYRGKTGKQAIRLLIVRYPEEARASSALRTFRAAYLPEKAGLSDSEPIIAHVEDGWMGAQEVGPFLILVFQCAENRIVQSFLQTSADALRLLGGEP